MIALICIAYGVNIILQSLSDQLNTLSIKCDDLSRELGLAASARDNFQSQISDLQLQIQDNQKNMESESIQRYNELLSKHD